MKVTIKEKHKCGYCHRPVKNIRHDQKTQFCSQVCRNVYAAIKRQRV